MKKQFMLLGTLAGATAPISAASAKEYKIGDKGPRRSGAKSPDPRAVSAAQTPSSASL
jgi:hypothetical protein